MTRTTPDWARPIVVPPSASSPAAEVTVSGDVLAALEHWAGRRGVPVAVLLGEAVGLEVTYCEALEAGDTLLLRSGDRLRRLGDS